MDNNQNRIEQLSSLILMHRRRYYAGQSIIADEVYDALEEELRVLDPNNSLFSQVGTPAEGFTGKKLSHNPPMLSLKKTYDTSEIFEFTSKYSCICTDKIDGMALSLEYDNHGNLLQASTRGNGLIGENVTEAIFNMPLIPKNLNIVTLPTDTIIEIRGEVFFPISKFSAFEQEFDSYRNAIPGTFGRKDINSAIPVLQVLDFCAYDIFVKHKENNSYSLAESNQYLNIPQSSYLARQQFLQKLGFNKNINNMDEVTLNSTEACTEFLELYFKKTRDYRIDGLVFRINDDIIWDNLGITSHHPRGSLAFKQAGEYATTEILLIEENIGRSGKITFRAKLSPVYLSGASISYATLHNAEFIEAGGYAPGAHVKITRSGEVIPSIIGLIKASEQPYTLPKTCPCGFALDRQGPDLFCREKGACAYKDHEALVYFVQSLEIYGVSDKIVLKMREAGLVKEPSDLFKITVADLLNLDGFAQKSAENIVQAIKSKQKIPLATFLTSLGISRGGAVKCKEVARQFKNIEKVLSLTTDDLLQLKGWAQKSASDFVNSLLDKKSIIDNLLQIIDIEPDNSLSSIIVGAFTGKTICITGALSRPRDEYKAILEKLGAKVSDSVSAKTSFLVCNDASSSSKYTKALNLGIEIITENALNALIEKENNNA